MRKTVFIKIVFFVIAAGAALPFLLGWQRVSFTEVMLGQRELMKETAQSIALRPVKPGDYAGITAYTILEKATASFHKVRSVHVDMEAWLENALFHVKMDFSNDMHNLDDYKTDGRVSMSLLLPNSFSTSYWVQTYQVRGIPFTWDLEKREWIEKEFKISGHEAKEILKFSILRSLFTINEGAVQPSSVKLLGIEQRQGRDCFVIQYQMAPEMFKRWDVVGEITIKTWVDTAEFLPRLLRAEGEIANLYLLQAVEYSRFNEAAALELPEDIKKRVAEQKDELKEKMPQLSKAAAEIRGWDVDETIGMEYIDRVSFGEYLTKELVKEYSEEELKNEAAVMKWLGLLPPEADYRDSMLNSQVASVGGLYDPETKKILMGDWIHPVYAEIILVHEIAHAYQDKLSDLKDFTKHDAPESSLDLTTARHAALEGEATAVMLEYLLRKEDKSFKGLGDIFALIDEKLLAQSEVKNTVLYNIYGYGANFVQVFLQQADWKELDRVYKAAPNTMEEIIHPFQYKGKISEEIASAEQIKMPVPDGWMRAYENTLGEFYLLLSLRQQLEKDAAERAVSGWKKDRILLCENIEGAKSVLLRTQWDNNKDAREYYKAFIDFLKKKHPQKEVKEQEAENTFLLELQDKQTFIGTLKNDWVDIFWTEGVTLETAQSLLKEIYAKSGA